jgi:hypothetical protein
MTCPGYRHFLFIIDHSGSMQRIRRGMQAGFLEFIRGQAAEPGRATGTLYQFDTVIERLYSFQALPELESYELIPDGGTSMYDAIAEAVTAEGEKLAAMPEDGRPEHIVVTIVSDGQENSSAIYHRDEGGGERVKAILDHQQDVYNWKIVYMGTNQDAFKEGFTVGIRTSSTLSYASTDAGSRGAWRATGQSVSRAAAMASAGGSFDVNYTAAERKLAAEGVPEDQPAAAAALPSKKAGK